MHVCVVDCTEAGSGLILAHPGTNPARSRPRPGASTPRNSQLYLASARQNRRNSQQPVDVRCRVPATQTELCLCLGNPTPFTK